MYLTIHLCFDICFIAIQQLPEDDQDRLTHVKVMTWWVKKYNFNIRAFLGFVVWIIYTCTGKNNFKNIQ